MSVVAVTMTVIRWHCAGATVCAYHPVVGIPIMLSALTFLAGWVAGVNIEGS